MSLPPISPLHQLGNRPFSFYPPILNIEQNEWFFRRASWSEILVMNSRSHLEIWIPRRFVGEISQIEDPVLIVGLVKELEYRAGAVWPHQRRVIEMPVAVGERPRKPAPAAQPAPVIGIRTESLADSRMGKLVGFTMLVGVVVSFIAVNVFRRGADTAYMELTRDDDYSAVVRKLGPPAEDHSQSGAGAIQFRSLWYPQRSYYVILMGTSRSSAHYIGAVDASWHLIHSVGSAGNILPGLKKF